MKDCPSPRLLPPKPPLGGRALAARPAVRTAVPAAWRRAAWHAAAVGLIALPGLVAATPLSPELLARAGTLAQSAAAALAPAGARVEALPGTLDARLNLAPCAQVDPYLVAGAPAWGRTRIGLRCNAGTVRWNVFLPLQVRVWAPAAVLRSELPAGARLTPEQLDSRVVDWADAAGPPQADAQLLAGRVLARPLAAGHAPRAADLQARQWFAAGETVQVLAVQTAADGGRLTVATEATALAAGIEGQPARVRTGIGRVLSGRAVGERRVEVSL